MNDTQSRRIILKELLDNKELTNGTIRTEDGGEFKVHLEILAAKSPYFKRIIGREKDIQWDCILVPGTSKEVMENIINFVYTGELCLSLDKISVLAKTSEILGIQEIIKMCKEFSISNLNDRNCFKIYTFAKESKYCDLKEEANNYIVSHFQRIFPISSDFLDLAVEDVVFFLSSDNLSVRNEDCVFMASMRWIEKDLTSRVVHLPHLLSCIRFGLTNSQLIKHNIWSHPYVVSNDECQNIMVQVSQVFKDLPSDITDQTIEIVFDSSQSFRRPRTPNEIIFVMGGWSAGSTTNAIETYDVNSRKWFLSLATDFTPKAYHGMLWHKGYIYIIGGFDGNQFFSSMKRFEPVTQIWEDKGCMYVQRCYVSVAAVEDNIYAMGGFDGHRRKKSCERYNPDTNQWTMIANMNCERSDAGADVLDGKIYIAGGFNGQTVLQSVEYYDPVTDQWTFIKNMNLPRSGVKLITYRDTIYAIGGYDGSGRLASVEKYDFKYELWMFIPEMNELRSNFAAAVLYDCIYVIGGYNGDSTMTSVEYYDSAKNAWTLVKELNISRSALSGCTVRDLRNAHKYTYLGNVK